MTASITDILPAVIARLLIAPAIQDGRSNVLPFRYNDDGGAALPDAPTAFAYVDIENFGSGRGPAAFGGGTGANLYRNEGLITIFSFVPLGDGVTVAMTQAEAIAARLRSFRSDTLSCTSADVHPPAQGESLRPDGLQSDVSNYTCAVIEIAMHFDQIG